MAPKVSVVIDNHNYGRFLPQALDSIIAQGYGQSEVEILVVDDGSTDDSRDILASYAPRVTSLLQDRKGQATAFNNGFAAAKGDIICLLDSDDVFMPGKLAAVLAAFDDPKVGCVQHFLHDTDGLLLPLPRKFPIWPARYRIEDLLGGRMELTATSGLSFRRDVLKKCLPIPKDLFYYLDDFLTMRSLFFGDVANIPTVFGLHRVHGGNWCAGGYEDPRKIERDFIDRTNFGAHRDRWLAEAGLTRTQDALDTDRLEVWRRKLLLESLRARPAEAARVWLEGLRDLPPGRQARFRAATLAIAVASPSLYLALYSQYSMP